MDGNLGTNDRMGGFLVAEQWRSPLHVWVHGGGRSSLLCNGAIPERLQGSL
jgi:hypothetical protein